MLSLRNNFLFLHVPKTAGNSIQGAISEYSEDKIVCLSPHQDGVERFEVRSDSLDIRKHSTLAEYKNQLPSDVFAGLFKFATVRNPWDRAISYYFSPHRGSVVWDRESFIEFLDHIDPVSHYVGLPGSDSASGLYQNIDCYMRFENLEEDFMAVCDKVGIPSRKLWRRNKSIKRDFWEYYDSELKEIVGQKFEADIEQFGYNFPC